MVGGDRGQWDVWYPRGKGLKDKSLLKESFKIHERDGDTGVIPQYVPVGAAFRLSLFSVLLLFFFSKLWDVKGRTFPRWRTRRPFFNPQRGTSTPVSVGDVSSRWSRRVYSVGSNFLLFWSLNVIWSSSSKTKGELDKVNEKSPESTQSFKIGLENQR